MRNFRINTFMFPNTRIVNRCGDFHVRRKRDTSNTAHTQLIPAQKAGSDWRKYNQATQFTPAQIAGPGRRLP